MFLHEEKKKDGIYIKGAKENNLKNIDVFIPYNKITAIVGVSGSGKSSLVNDTIYKECHRKMEYLNHNRNLLAKPNVDYIDGVIPAININQASIRANTLSTVGTYVNAYDYLRIIYTSIGIRHCPDCGNEIIPLTIETIKKVIEKTKATIYSLNKELITNKTIEEVLKDSNGAIYIKPLDSDDFILLQTKDKCYNCDKIMFTLSPQAFSYLDKEARCPICNGMGEINEIDLKKIIPDDSISLLDGAIPFYGKLSEFLINPNANWMKGQVIALAKMDNVDLNLPWCDLPESFKHDVLFGVDKLVTFAFNNKRNGRNGVITRTVEGLVNIITRMSVNFDQETMNRFYSKTPCKVCNGERLNKEGRMVTVNNIRYPISSKYSFDELSNFLKSIEENLTKQQINKVSTSINALKEIINASISLGISYLSLGQVTNTLSSGEQERLKILGAYLNHLSHLLYIFDEPSKGLDKRDYKSIIQMMNKLKSENNTIIMVEHNIDMIEAADNIIELGPKAGVNGGLITGSGNLNEIKEILTTDMSKYYKEKRVYPHNELKDFITFKNLNANNLKDITINIPKHAITSIYGVSGSGKSTLLKKEIYIKAPKYFSDCILVDASSISKNSKSIVATMMGMMDDLRNIFAGIDIAKEKGYTESHFSFNQEEGACETCKGDGKLEIKFFEDEYTVCPDCDGKRYKKDILKIKYKDKNISDILNLSVDEANTFFEDHNFINQVLNLLKRVGLGYLKIGQSTNTLSGGEASRLKLAKELIKGKKRSKQTKDILYLFDEPTMGLHFSDIDNLINLIKELSIDNTVIVIEHNKQFLEASDYLIELGPKAGQLGGYVIEQGENKINN